MKQFWMSFLGSVVGVLAALALGVVFLAFLIGGLISAALEAGQDDAAVRSTGAIVLELDLREPRLDQTEPGFLALGAPVSIVELTRTLERARTDPRVAGVFVRAAPMGLPPAQAEEIARLLARLSDAGKTVTAHAQGFESPSITGYFAVAGADSLWLQSSASFSAVGLSTETLFLGGLFERFGAQPQFVQFHEYKNAADVYTQTGYTDAHREATLSWLQSVFETALSQISARRGAEPDALTAQIVNGPYSAEQALELGLVDQLGHVAAAREAALAQAGDSARIVTVQDYALQSVRPSPALSNPAVIALVGGQGQILTGDAAPGLGGGAAIGGDTLAQAIMDAANDPAVRAIVLRIDSPGGSAIASDQIWDAVMRARQAGKPVVASMGALAASGGYYIAAPADLIVANATTLTGSIGMLGGKIVLDGALAQVGLNLEPLAVGGEYALAYSAATPWSETQQAAYERLAEDVYDDFTARVAEGRDLPLARVETLARGRIWTGAQALDLGLVDRIGGLTDAIAAARELGGVGADETVTLRAYPAEPSVIEAIQALFGVSAETAETLAQIRVLMDTPQAQALMEANRAISAGASPTLDAPR